MITQKNIEVEDPDYEDLYMVGTLAHIHKMIKMPDGSVTIVIQGRSKIEVQDFTQKDPYFKGKISKA